MVADVLALIYGFLMSIRLVLKHNCVSIRFSSWMLYEACNLMPKVSYCGLDNNSTYG